MKDKLKNIIIGLTCASLVSAANASGNTATAKRSDSAFTLPDSIVVTAYREPTSLTSLSRSVQVITKQEIESYPVHSVEDVLAYALGVDARSRGQYGVQTDISIRGATFEQTQILIDGVKVSDPQTGHHNFNIPLTLSDIERIEVLRGSASRLYGPNATGGVINIITALNTNSEVAVDLFGGENGFTEKSVSLSHSAGNLTNRLSMSRRRSDGYIEDTDFDIRSYFYNGAVQLSSGLLHLSAGLLDKKFGAFRFYTGRFPEWEATSTHFYSAGGEFNLGVWKLSPKLSWRKNKDEFVLVRGNPAVYRNLHSTDHYSAEIQTSVRTRLGTSVISAEYGGEKISSSNLNNHTRSRRGFVMEQHFPVWHKLSFVAGSSLFHHSNVGWKLWPGLDVGYDVSQHVRTFASVDGGYRVPTFTELFYVSPANMGNKALQPEKTWTYEVGTQFHQGWLRSEISIFMRRGENLIDWARNSGATQWQVRNVFRATTQGIELSVAFNPQLRWQGSPLTAVSAEYSYLNSDRSASEQESKYLLSHLKHQLTLKVNHRWISRLHQSWNMRYFRRLHDNGHIVVDTKLSLGFHGLDFSLEARNLFNESYTSISSVSMPGRWIITGISTNIGK